MYLYTPQQSYCDILYCKKISVRIYGKISGNQLPGHVLLFFTGTTYTCLLTSTLSHDHIPIKVLRLP